MPPTPHGLEPGPPYASYVPCQWATPGLPTILWVGTPMPPYSRHWYNNDVIHWTSCKISVCGWEGDWWVGASTRAWVWICSPHEKLAQQCTAVHSNAQQCTVMHSSTLLKFKQQGGRNIKTFKAYWPASLAKWTRSRVSERPYFKTMR